MQTISRIHLTKHCLVILIFVCFFLKSNGQETIQTLKFLKQIRKNVFKNLFKGDSLFYTASVNDMAIAEIKKQLSKDMIGIYEFLDSGRVRTIDSITFTQDEKLIISKQLKELDWNIWSDNLLKKSKLDTIPIINRFGPPTEMKKDIYSFSRPIFLRDNTFCFFYYHHYYGYHGQYGELALYKKIKKKWNHIQVLFWGGI